MKNPFKKSPMGTLENTIATLAKRGEQLAAKRVAAQNTLDAAIKARQQALLAGDLNDERALSKVQGAVDGAVSALAGIDDAIAVLTQQKAEADAQLAAERDRVERDAAAEALAGQVAAIEAALPKWLAETRAFNDALTAVTRLRHFESTEIAQFIQSAAAQVEVACNLSLGELKALPNLIRNGQAPVPREEPAPAPLVMKPAPETRTLFALRSLKWTDAEGRVRYCQHVVPQPMH